MNLIFLGTPLLSAKLLNHIKNKYNVVAVITRPDKPIGRSKKEVPSPVAIEAELSGISIYKPVKIDSELISELNKLSPDLFITFSYGAILRQPFLELTKYGGINIHPSILPEYRGPSPIQAALLDGKSQSGITVQKVALKVDSGDILAQETFMIAESDNYYDIELAVSELAAKITLDVLTNFSSGNFNGTPQIESDATYCKIIKKEDALIDWTLSSRKIHNLIRAFVEWPCGFSYLNNEKITFYKSEVCDILMQQEHLSQEPGTIVEADNKNGILIKTGSGLLKINELQREGKNKLEFKSFINGYQGLKNKKFN